MRTLSSLTSLLVFCIGLVLFAVCSIGGCSSSEAPLGSFPKEPHSPTGNLTEVKTGGATDGVTVARKIIYTCQIQTVVEDFTPVAASMKQLISDVTHAGGYLASMELHGSTGQDRGGLWIVRVPLNEMDSFIEAVTKIGVVELNSRSSQDVTDAFADLEVRIRNKQASEERILSYLEQSSKLTDTLQLENELTRVRGEIEQLQGQLNVMKNKTDLATVTVRIREEKNYVPPTKPTFNNRVVVAFGNSWETFIAFWQAVAILFVVLSPWLVVGIIVLLLGWIIKRFFFRR